MHHADDDQLVRVDKVIDRVGSVKRDAKPRREIVPWRPGKRKMPNRFKCGTELVEKLRRDGLRGFGGEI